MNLSDQNVTIFMKFSSLLFYVSIITFLFGCNGESAVSVDNGGNDSLEARSFKVGVTGLIPKNYPEASDADYMDLFNSLPGYGEYLGLNVAWNQAETDEDGIPLVVKLAYKETEGTTITPYIALGISIDAMTDLYFHEHGEAFKDASIAIAETYRPGIMLIGTEINRYFESSTVGFNLFMGLYNDIYDAIKEVSPNTLVGSHFQLDFMRGVAIRAGVQRPARWDLLGQFEPNLDIAAFSAYPFLGYNHPAEIPDNYLSQITDFTDRPVIITETGWPTEVLRLHPQISADEEVQLDYFEILKERIKPIPLYSLNWAFPHDPLTGQNDELFDTIGLRQNNGTPKRIQQEWLDLAERPFE
jgi:hypothetical protein